MSAGYGYDPDEDPDALKRPDLDQEYEGGGGDLARPQFENPALALSGRPQALPDERPALALAPEERGGGAPTNALALQQPDENAVDAVSGPPGGGPPAAQPAIPGGDLNTDQLMRAALTDYPGMIEPGNIDLTNRPHVKNADGSTSTVRSIGVNVDGKEVLIPTVSEDGRIMSDEEAIEQYKKTGRHLGKFDSVAASNNAAERIHEQQSSLIDQQPAKALTPQEQEQKLMGEQDKLLEQQIDAKKRADAAQAKINDEQAKYAAQQAQIEQAHAAEQQQIISQANARTQQWMDRQQAEMDKFQNMGLHDYVQDMPLFNKILAGLSMLTGAAGGTPPDRNPGVIAIKDATERNFRLQQQAILKQKEMVGMAKEGVDTSLSMKQQQLADSNLKKAAAYDAVAAQGVAMKLRQGVPLAEANNDAAIVSLRQAAAQTRMETLKSVHSQNVQDAQLDIGRQKLLTEKERADAAMLSAQNRGHKGHGGGGGGGSSAMQDFVDAAGELKPGERIPAQVVALGIKAGLKKDKIADQVDKYRNSGNKSAKGEFGANVMGARLMSKEVTDWARQNQIPQLIKKQDELQAVTDEIDAAPHNPLQQALAVEKAVSSARGGAASKQALALALEHLGRKYTSIGDVKRAIISKELGEKQMENFVAFIRNQLGQAQKEGLGKYQEFNNYIASQPTEKRGELEAQRGRVFSGVSGFGGKSKANVAEAPDVSEPTPPSGGNALPGGNKIVKVRDKATGKIIEAVKTSNGTLLDKATGQPLK